MRRYSRTFLTFLIVFIYTCPAASPFKEKPVYAACRSSVVGAAKNLGIKIDREVCIFKHKGPSNAVLTSCVQLEVELPVDINLEDEFHPKEETKKAFQRPRRPGRR
jgi:twinfilin-like protein